MRRREFIGLLVGSAGAWPLTALSQQRPRYPTVAFITTATSKDDVEMQGRVRAFESGWSKLGWVEGRNIHVDYRWGEPSQIRAVVEELVASAPDVIVANGTSVLNAVRLATNSIPVVFTGISDPEGIGIVANIARPGGNMTGLANFEPAMGGKWLQTLMEIAPSLTRVGVLRVVETHVRILQSIKDYGASNRIETVDCAVRDDGGIRAAINALAGQPATGLIVLPDPMFSTYRALIFELAANQRHPAIYPFRNFAKDGGLLSYGINISDQIRKSAFYVDLILKGTHPGDLPVQAPTEFELVINLKTAKALGLDVPTTLLARADAIIE
jgi:putative ABC transport system substrate-binding protein